MGSTVWLGLSGFKSRLCPLNSCANLFSLVAQYLYPCNCDHNTISCLGVLWEYDEIVHKAPKIAPKHSKNSYYSIQVVPISWPTSTGPSQEQSCSGASFLYHVHWFVSSAIQQALEVSPKTTNFLCYHKKDCLKVTECESYAFYYIHVK